MAINTKKKAKKTPKTTKKTTKKVRKISSARNAAELADFALGQEKTLYPETYAPHVLEAFPNKNPGSEAWTTFVCTEFTSLCPKTNQPDFARIFINYIADKTMVESKSLKLYLFSFRNHGDFHEDCVQKMCNDLFKLIKPKFIEVIGEFTPRGGIAIYPYSSQSSASHKKLKEHRQLNYAPGLYTMPLSRVY